MEEFSWAEFPPLYEARKRRRLDRQSIRFDNGHSRRFPSPEMWDCHQLKGDSHNLRNRSDVFLSNLEGYKHRTRNRNRSHSRSRYDGTDRRQCYNDPKWNAEKQTRDTLPCQVSQKNRYTGKRRSRKNDTSNAGTDVRSSLSGKTPSQENLNRKVGRTGVVSDDDDWISILSTEKCDRQSPTERKDTRRSPKNVSLRARSRSSSRNDTIGHFSGRNGTVIADRYKILREIGIGTFGRVVECLDLRYSGRSSRKRVNQPPHVALKIVRKIQRYHDSAVIEANIIRSINRLGGRGLTHCIVLYDSFSFEGYYCMVTEPLGASLYDYLKRRNFQPFPMICVQDFAIQLLEVLEFLHGECRLIHTDLKIENILLMNDAQSLHENHMVPQSTRIKLIDFGGACYDSDKKSSIINTRQYRAPEVILGTGWSFPSDMWSAGCILTELYQGDLLFATHDNIEHLALIEQVIGHFPRRMIKAASTSRVQTDLSKDVFDSKGRHRMHRILSTEKIAHVRKCLRLERLIHSRDAWFLDLLKMILVIDQNERATAHECLKFLTRIRRNSTRLC